MSSPSRTMPSSTPARVRADDGVADEVAALHARRQALLDRLAAIRADVARGLDRDSGERAVELENAEVLDEIARVGEEELGDIESRLAEIRTGGRR